MAETALLVGSMPIDAALTIDGNATTIEGNYYLRHATGSLSALQVLEDRLVDEGVTATVTMLENLLIQIESSSGNFDLTWNSTILREIYGFAGNLTGADTYTAANPSPLLWAPGYPATPRSRTHKRGRLVPHTTFHAADDGSSRQTQHFGSEIWQELRWGTLLTERLQVPDGDDVGNTLEGLFEYVLQFGYRLMHHQSVVVDYNDDDPLSWNDSEAFGPYQLREEMDPDWYERIIANADAYAGPVVLELAISEEYQ